MIAFDAVDADGVRHTPKRWSTKKRGDKPRGVALCGAAFDRVEPWKPGDRRLCDKCLEMGGEA